MLWTNRSLRLTLLPAALILLYASARAESSGDTTTTQSPAPSDGVLACGGRVVPPMTPPVLPGGEWDSATQPPPRKWDRALPFFAQRVINKGADLPNPYDVGLSLYIGHEERNLSSLEVGFNGGPKLDTSFVQFPNTSINNQSLQIQAGAWLFHS